MQRMRTVLMAGCCLAMGTVPAFARDFYVQPSNPGPVSGAPLGAVSLQATTTDTAATTEGSTFKLLQTTVNERGNTAGKWLRPGAKGTSNSGDAVTVGQTTKTSTATASSTATTAATTTGMTTTTATATAPVSTSATANTYQSIAEVFASGLVTGGDRILLMAGYHGPMMIQGQKFASPVVIEPVPGQVAHVDSLQIRSSQNITVQDLKVWSSNNKAGQVAVLRTYGDTSDILFSNMDVRSVSDSGNYMNWSLGQWLSYKRSGVLLDGNRVSIVGSRVTGVYNGIVSQAANAVIRNNIVDGFGGDGMRALGDYTLVQGNKIQNCFDIDPNHDDGFQSYSTSAAGKAGQGTLYGLKVIGNKIIEWSQTATNPLRCNLQGIGMFDGIYKDLVIQNNLIAVSAYHGITVAGAQNAVIANNTVVNIMGQSQRYPWIQVSYDKDGTPSSNVVIANNLAMNIKQMKGQSNVTFANNRTIAIQTEFASIAAKNFALSTVSPAANAGVAKYAPSTDIMNVPRPKGSGPDIGAYETR